MGVQALPATTNPQFSSSIIKVPPCMPLLCEIIFPILQSLPPSPSASFFLTPSFFLIIPTYLTRVHALCLCRLHLTALKVIRFSRAAFIIFSYNNLTLLSPLWFLFQVCLFMLLFSFVLETLFHALSFFVLLLSKPVLGVCKFAVLPGSCDPGRGVVTAVLVCVVIFTQERPLSTCSCKH